MEKYDDDATRRGLHLGFYQNFFGVYKRHISQVALVRHHCLRNRVDPVGAVVLHLFEAFSLVISLSIPEHYRPQRNT